MKIGELKQIALGSDRRVEASVMRHHGSVSLSFSAFDVDNNISTSSRLSRSDARKVGAMLIEAADATEETGETNAHD